MGQEELKKLLMSIGIDISNLQSIETVGSCPHGLKEKRKGNIIRCLQHGEIWICFPMGDKN